MSEDRAVVIPETIRLEIGGAKLEVRYERVTGWQEHVLAAGRRESLLQKDLDILIATNKESAGLVEKLRSELAAAQAACLHPRLTVASVKTAGDDLYRLNVLVGCAACGYEKTFDRIVEGKSDAMKAALEEIDDALLDGSAGGGSRAEKIRNTFIQLNTFITDLRVEQSNRQDLERKVRELVTSTIGGQPASRTTLECVVAIAHELNRAIKTIEEQGAALIAAGVGVR